MTKRIRRPGIVSADRRPDEMQPAPSGAAGSARATLVKLLPSRLTQMLGLQADAVPHRLHPPGAVAPIVDAYQSGWTLANYLTTAGSQPGGAAVATVELLPQDEGLVRRIMAGRLVTSVVAGANVSIALRRTLPSGGQLQVELTAVLIPDGEVFGNEQLFPAGHPLIVPPGFNLVINFPATAAGEIVASQFVVAEAPAGYSLAL